ncbi:MAG: hypothetical protein AB1779_08945, partial [Candidatus Thermoplasmatota archaeon]
MRRKIATFIAFALFLNFFQIGTESIVEKEFKEKISIPKNAYVLNGTINITAEPVEKIIEYDNFTGFKKHNLTDDGRKLNVDEWSWSQNAEEIESSESEMDRLVITKVDGRKAVGVNGTYGNGTLTSPPISTPLSTYGTLFIDITIIDYGSKPKGRTEMKPDYYIDVLVNRDGNWEVKKTIYNGDAIGISPREYSEIKLRLTMPSYMMLFEWGIGTIVKEYFNQGNLIDWDNSKNTMLNRGTLTISKDFHKKWHLVPYNYSNTEKTPQGLLFPSVVWNNKKNVLLVYGGFKERINETGELNITG